MLDETTRRRGAPAAAAGSGRGPLSSGAVHTAWAALTLAATVARTGRRAATPTAKAAHAGR